MALSNHYPASLIDLQTQLKLEHLREFYKSPELPILPTERRSPLLTSIRHAPLKYKSDANYYQALWEPDDDFPHHLNQYQDINALNRTMVNNSTAPPTPSSQNFPEHTGITKLTDLIQKQNISDDKMEEDLIENPPSPAESFSTNLETLSPSRLHLNLIRHKFATTTELTTLQLFKSFMTATRKADNNLIILPVDSTKQGFTSLASQKQLDQLNDDCILHPGLGNNITPSVGSFTSALP